MTPIAIGVQQIPYFLHLKTVDHTRYINQSLVEWIFYTGYWGLAWLDWIGTENYLQRLLRVRAYPSWI